VVGGGSGGGVADAELERAAGGGLLVVRLASSRASGGHPVGQEAAPSPQRRGGSAARRGAAERRGRGRGIAGSDEEVGGQIRGSKTAITRPRMCGHARGGRVTSALSFSTSLPLSVPIGPRVIYVGVVCSLEKNRHCTHEQNFQTAQKIVLHICKF
jgi:hypothetical protein